MCDSTLGDIQSSGDSQATLLISCMVGVGYASTSDKQRIEAFIRQGVQHNFCGMGHPTAQQRADDADKRLFQSSGE